MPANRAKPTISQSAPCPNPLSTYPPQKNLLCPPPLAPLPQENVLLVEWCAVDILVAVATDDFQINFYGDEGALLPACVISRQHNAAALKWQHKSCILATGWHDGHIGVYSVNSAQKKLDCVYTNDQSHTGGISFLMWNPACNRLVSGDAKGLVRVWKVGLRV